VRRDGRQPGGVARGEQRIYFTLTWRTGVVFIVGAALVLWVWKIVLNEADTPRQRFARRLVKGLLIISAAAAFLYPLRFVPKSKLPEIAIGLGFAVCALSIVGYLLLRARSFLEADEEEVESGK
jgi:amino acid transporter